MSITQQITRIQNEVSNQSNLIDAMSTKLDGQTDYASILIGVLQKTITEYNDNNLTEIGKSMLSDCLYLTDINTPNLQFVQDYACQGDTALTNLYAPNLIYVGNSSFYNCNIQNLDAPKLREIHASAFYMNHNLNVTSLPSARYIGTRAFYECSGITNLTLDNIAQIGSYAFQESNLTNLYLNNRNVVCSLVSDTCFNNTPLGNGDGYVYVPSVIYDRYLGDSTWVYYKQKLRFNGEYVEQLSKAQYILTNSTTEISIPIYQYTSDISISINGYGSDYINNVTYNITDDAIIFYINAKGNIGQTQLTYTVTGKETFTRTIDIKVVDEIPNLSYSVTNISTTYGFFLQSDGYYKSSNANANNSYSLCRVTFVGDGLATIQWKYEGETCCDYGVVSKINTGLTLSTSDNSSDYVQKITSNFLYTFNFTDGDFIDIKYRKDGSVNTGTDCLQFMITLE